MSYRGTDDGPTLTETTAERGLLVRVLGSSVGRGLSGYIVEGENGPKPTIEFDDGSRRAYDVFRLQMYMPRGKPEFKKALMKRKPSIPHISSPRTPAPPRPHVVVKEPDDPKLRRRQPLNPQEESEQPAEPKERMVRDDADWNF